MHKLHKEFIKDAIHTAFNFTPLTGVWASFKMLKKWIYDDNQKGVSIKKIIKGEKDEMQKL